MDGCVRKLIRPGSSRQRKRDRTVARDSRVDLHLDHPRRRDLGRRRRRSAQPGRCRPRGGCHAAGVTRFVLRTVRRRTRRRANARLSRTSRTGSAAGATRAYILGADATRASERRRQLRGLRPSPAFPIAPRVGLEPTTLRLTACPVDVTSGRLAQPSGYRVRSGR
jgi:hypothetical protein